MRCLKSPCACLLLSLFVKRAHGVVTGTNRRWEVNPNAYCEDYGELSTQKLHDYNSPGGARAETTIAKQDCLDKCDKEHSCIGIQMDCLHRCHLLKNCSNTVRSNCESYLAVKPDLITGQNHLAEAMLKHPQRKQTFSFVLVAILIGTILFTQRLCNSKINTGDLTSEYSFAILDPDAQIPPIRPAAPTDEEDTLWKREDSLTGSPLFSDRIFRRRIGVTCSIVLCMLLFVHDALSLNAFPDDHVNKTHTIPRGACGLVREDLTPLSLLDLLAWRFQWTQTSVPSLVMNGSFHKPPALDALPTSCVQIYSTDFICDYSGPHCYSWCNDVMGASSHWLCILLVPEFADMYKVCTKVSTWNNWVRRIPENFRNPIQYGLPIFYCLLAGIVGTMRYRWLKDEGRLAKLDEVTGPRSNLPCTSKYYPGERLQFPWWFVRVRSDEDGAFKTLLTYIPSFMLDLWGDLNAGLAFFFKGEPTYAAVILALPLASNIHDPLQANNVCAVWMSFHHRFAVYEMSMVHRREGACEGVYSVIIVIFAIMRGVFYGSFVNQPYIFVSLTLNLCISVCLTIPQATRASYVIMNKYLGSHHDYYKVEDHKANLKDSIKILPTLETLALAVAVGRSFTDLSHLFWLWFIGFAIGFFGSLIWLLYCKNYQSITPFFAAFFCWPCAATRLLGTYRVLVRMLEGKLDWEVCFKGSASLLPRLHYTHRLLTLSVFWIYAFSRDDSDIFQWLLEKIKHEQYSSLIDLVAGPLCVALIFAVGWWSMIHQAYIICTVGEEFDGDYERMAHDVVLSPHLRHASVDFVDAAFDG